MALSIPFNLAGSAAVQTQPSSMAAGVASAAKVTTVQPAGPGSDTRNAASDGADSRGQSAATYWSQISKSRTSGMATPDGATSNSVVNAQAQAGAGIPIAQSKPKFDSPATAPANSEQIMEPSKKVDRYAPPDPLPTAPILKQRTAALKQV